MLAKQSPIQVLTAELNYILAENLLCKIPSRSLTTWTLIRNILKKGNKRDIIKVNFQYK